MTHQEKFPDHPMPTVPSDGNTINVSANGIRSASPDKRDRENPRSARWVNPAVGTVAGLAAYFALGFQHTLSPRRIDWLLGFSLRDWYYDPATAFVGWHYFRNSPWTFPPGLNLSYGMEYAGSIAFSDSIPVLAYIFKPFSHLLGTNFQYCGIWILICFILQGIFGALLASLFTRGVLSKLIIAGFFAMSPIMLERGWTEYSLMGQWLLLWAIYLYLSNQGGSIRWVWMILIVLAVNIHFYFVPMLLLIWAADWIRRAFLRRTATPWMLSEVIGMCAATLLAMWISGFFVLATRDAVTDEFGKFAANILGPIDPWGFSLFLRPEPKSSLWLGEGFCYLGLGMILLGFMAIFEILRKPVPRNSVIRMLPLVLAMLGLAAFSLSHRAAFGSHIFYLRNIYLQYGPIFRASGRMIWPGYYGLWIGIIYIVTSRLKPGRALALLAIMLGLQILDLIPSHRPMRERNASYPAWELHLKDPFWDAAGSRYRHIAIVPSGASLSFIPLAYWGANRGLSTNGTYLARFPGDATIAKFTEKRWAELKENRPDPDTLYIVPNASHFAQMRTTLGKEHGLGQIDSYNIIAPYWFADGHPVGPGILVEGARSAAVSH